MTRSWTLPAIGEAPSMTLLRALIAVAALTALVLQTGATASHASTSSASADDFKAALDASDAAQLEFQNGRPAAFKALWSNADDVTLAGGFGGQVEKGWAAVSRRLDWAGSQFTNGTHQNVRLTASSSGDLGYVVQLEHIRFTPVGSAEPTTRDFRVTMVFRREASGWRIVHRHADAQVTKEAPR